MTQPHLQPLPCRPNQINYWKISMSYLVRPNTIHRNQQIIPSKQRLPYSSPEAPSDTWTKLVFFDTVERKRGRTSNFLHKEHFSFYQVSISMCSDPKKNGFYRRQHIFHFTKFELWLINFGSGSDWWTLVWFNYFGHFFPSPTNNEINENPKDMSHETSSLPPKTLCLPKRVISLNV